MFSLVIPFHSDFQRVISTLALLSTERDKWLIKEILLCHNGPWEEAFLALKPYADFNIKLLHTADKGIGAAYRLGILNASEQYVILSASDLPFGFSDNHRFQEYYQCHGVLPDLAIGSKFHSKSDIGRYPISRKIYSRLFYFARLLVLGRSTPKDSQGTIIGSVSVLRNLVTQVSSQDYFFSLELLSIAISKQLVVIELPITLVNHEQESSVAPIEDGMAMFARLFMLRRSLRSLHR